ncbi:MAG: epoxyqueuosine reductase QueH [Oscillospiraceae bacterium]
MNTKINYQKKLDEILISIEKNNPKPRLLLHSCCAPCSSYVLEYLSNYFEIFLLFYNPNIVPFVEYDKRFKELKRLIAEMKFPNNVQIFDCEYENEKFKNMAKGLEDEPEGFERCFRCYWLRMEKTAIIAKANNFDYFTTTLSISPHKNAQKLNEIGYNLQEKYETKYLCADFKKNEGYKRSIQLSKEYNLYRQIYCGCTPPKSDLHKII